MLHVAHNVEDALLLELGVALDVEAAFLRAAGGIDEGVGGAGDDLHVDALTVLDMHCGAAVHRCGVGQRETVELDGGFIGAGHVELAIGGGAAEVVGNLGGEGAALRDGDVCSLLADSQVLDGAVAHADRGVIAIVDDIHAVVALRHKANAEKHRDYIKECFLHNMLCLWFIFSSLTELSLVQRYGDYYI